MRVSVIIVSYNTRQLLRECLQALGTEFEVIVVDNASRDGSAYVVREEFPHVVLVENAVNRGFGAANNQGLAVMTGDLALLLNSDARPEPGAIRVLAGVFESNASAAPPGLWPPSPSQARRGQESEIGPPGPGSGESALPPGPGSPIPSGSRNTEGLGAPIPLGSGTPHRDKQPIIAAGGALHFPDGRLQQSACRELTLWAVFCEQFLLEKLFPNSPLFSPYWMSSRLKKRGQGPHEVEQVMGACLMYRPVERFNEDFFLYAEDTDLCKRLRKQGKILYVPAAKFIHHLGASSETTRWESVARYNRGKELYFEIHHGKGAAKICLILNRMGAFLRVLAGLPLVFLTLGLKSSKKFDIFKQVLVAPINGPSLPPDSAPKP